MPQSPAGRWPRFVWWPHGGPPPGRIATGLQDRAPNPRASRRPRIRCMVSEQDPGELAMTEPGIDFGDRGVDEEQTEDPDLNGGVQLPGEVVRHIVRHDSAPHLYSRSFSRH